MARGRRVNASGDGIRVTGLTELNRALRQVDPVLQKELKAANLEVAQDVTLAAKGKAAGLGSTAAKVARRLVPLPGTWRLACPLVALHTRLPRAPSSGLSSMHSFSRSVVLARRWLFRLSRHS